MIEQILALCISLSTQKQQIIDMALGITVDSGEITASMLEKIQSHIRPKRSAAIDRVVFEEYQPTPGDPWMNSTYDWSKLRTL